MCGIGCVLLLWEQTGGIAWAYRKYKTVGVVLEKLNPNWRIFNIFSKKRLSTIFFVLKNLVYDTSSYRFYTDKRNYILHRTFATYLLCLRHFVLLHNKKNSIESEITKIALPSEYRKIIILFILRIGPDFFPFSSITESNLYRSGFVRSITSSIL